MNIIKKISPRSLPGPRIKCMMSVQTVYGQWDGEWDRGHRETPMRSSHLREYTIVHSHYTKVFSSGWVLTVQLMWSKQQNDRARHWWSKQSPCWVRTGQPQERWTQSPPKGSATKTKKLGDTNNRVAIDSARSLSLMSISSSKRGTCPPLSCGDVGVGSVSFARCSSVVLGLPLRPPFDGGGLCGESVPACWCSARPPEEHGLAFASGISPEFALVPLSVGSRECSTSPETGSHPMPRWAVCEIGSVIPPRPLPALSLQDSPSLGHWRTLQTPTWKVVASGAPSALSPRRCLPFPAPWLLRMVGTRPRLPPPAMFDRETLRVDVWIGHTVAGARLDDRSKVRCVRDDVSASLLIDSSVFSWASRSICGTWRVHHHHRIVRCAPRHLPAFGFRWHSSGRRGSTLSFFYLLILGEEHVSLLCAHCQPQEVSPWEHCRRNKTVQLLQTSLSE